jgi:hypothetical protein
MTGRRSTRFALAYVIPVCLLSSYWVCCGLLPMMSLARNVGVRESRITGMSAGLVAQHADDGWTRAS